MKHLFLFLALCSAAVAATGNFSGSATGTSWSGTWTTTTNGSGFTVTWTGSLTSTVNGDHLTINDNSDTVSVVSRQNSGNITGSYTVTSGTTHTFKMRLFSTNGGTSAVYVKFGPSDVVVNHGGSSGVMLGRSYNILFLNSTGSARMYGWVRASEPTKIYDTKQVSPGGVYSSWIDMAASDTSASFYVVEVDYEKILADATLNLIKDASAKTIGIHTSDPTAAVQQGGAITYAMGTESQINPSNMGSAGPGVTTTPSPSPQATAATVANPRYVSVFPPGSLGAGNATDPLDKGSLVDATNTLTGSLKDLQDALSGGLTANIDTAGMQAKQQATTDAVTAGNAKLDSIGSKIDSGTAMTSSLGTKLDASNTKADAAAIIRAQTNSKLDTISSSVSASGAIVSKLTDGTTLYAAGNAKLASIDVWAAQLATLFNEANSMANTAATARSVANSKLGDIGSNGVAIAGKLDQLIAKTGNGTVSGEDLTAIKNNTAITAEKLTQLHADHKAAKDTQKTSAEIESAASAKKTQGEAVIAGLSNFSMDPYTGPLNNGDQSSMFVVEMFNYTFDLDPSKSALVSTGAAWIKSVIMWVTLIAYVWWVIHELESQLKTWSAATQARGNAVALGSGSQLTAFTAAVAITVVIFAAIPSIWAIATIPGVSTSNPVGQGGSVLSPTGWLGGVMYLVYFFIPLQYLLSIVAHQFVFKKAALSVMVGVITFIRHVTP